MTTPVLDFAIIGAQKSASTFVHHCLMRHPQIDVPSEESRNFEDPYYARGGVEGLEGLFGPRRPGVRRGLKRPDHLADPAVPARLSSAAPALKLVTVLRDPVPRAVSAYFHYERLGFLPMLPLERGMAAVLDGTLARTYPRAADVLRYGQYGEHLDRYRRHFAPDQFLVLWQDDLRADATRPLRRLLDFLEVSTIHTDRLVAGTPRANETSYWVPRVRLQRSRNRFLFTYDTARYRRTPRRPTPAGWSLAAAATAVDRTILARLDRHQTPDLPIELARELRRYYEQDTERLRQIVGEVPWSPTAER